MIIIIITVIFIITIIMAIVMSSSSSTLSPPFCITQIGNVGAGNGNRMMDHYFEMANIIERRRMRDRMATAAAAATRMTTRGKFNISSLIN
jgi:hypothetical protein